DNVTHIPNKYTRSNSLHFNIKRTNPYANGLVLYLEHEIYILSSVICYLTIHYIVKICIDLLINYDITLLFVVRSNSIKNPQVFSSSHILLIPVLILSLIFA